MLAFITTLGALPILLLIEGEGFADDRREAEVEEEEEVGQSQAPLSK